MQSVFNIFTSAFNRVQLRLGQCQKFEFKKTGCTVRKERKVSCIPSAVTVSRLVFRGQKTVSGRAPEKKESLSNDGGDPEDNA